MTTLMVSFGAEVMDWIENESCDKKRVSCTSRHKFHLLASDNEVLGKFLSARG